MTTDGGYYAIKGFEFQIDKTILEILNSDNADKLIGLEQIQDINSNDFVMQVKYKETQDYALFKIKEPVIQLIKEFEKEQSRNYYLYCFFKNKNAGEENIDISVLNDLLGNKHENFADDLKNNFVTKFKLIFSPDFQQQFEKAINKLQTFDFCNNSDEAIIYYSTITDFLRKLIVKNFQMSHRNCTKQQILDLIQNNKKIVFDSSFREYKGEKEYFKYIKNQYFSFKNPDNWERFFVIELGGDEKVSDIKNVLLKIKERFYINNKRGLKSGAPYIYFQNILPEKLKLLKTKLLSEGYVFKDGHDFKDADFNKKTILDKSTKENKVCLKNFEFKE